MQPKYNACMRTGLHINYFKIIILAFLPFLTSPNYIRLMNKCLISCFLALRDEFHKVLLNQLMLRWILIAVELTAILNVPQWRLNSSIPTGTMLSRKISNNNETLKTKFKTHYFFIFYSPDSLFLITFKWTHCKTHIFWIKFMLQERLKLQN